MESEMDLELLRVSAKRAREILRNLSQAAVREFSQGEQEAIDLAEVDDALAVFDALLENQKPLPVFIPLREAAISLCGGGTPCGAVLNWVAEGIAGSVKLFSWDGMDTKIGRAVPYPAKMHRMHGGGVSYRHLVYPDNSSYGPLVVNRIQFMSFANKISREGEELSQG